MQQFYAIGDDELLALATMANVSEVAGGRRLGRRQRSGYGLMHRLFNVMLPLALVVLVALPAAAAEPVRLMVLGDSLTAGYGLPEEEAFPSRLEEALTGAERPVRVINAGVSGDTTAGGLARLDWALADNPTHALVALGANDALRGLDPGQARQNLEQIVQRLKEEGIEVMLAGMYAPPNFGRDYSDAFNGIFPALAEEFDVPLYAFFLDGVALVPELNQRDGIHPNARGVDVMVEKIAPAIRAFLDRDRSVGEAHRGDGHG